jgi:hypothetical protein
MAAAALLLLSAIPGAHAQVADIPVPASPLSRLLFVRTGTFEVRQDTTLLGTEFYRIYLTPGRDSLLVSGHITYELPQVRGGHVRYEKHSLRILRALDNYLAMYQTHEEIGGRERALALATHDTSVSIFHEADGRGEGNVIPIPPGRVYTLDPSAYEQVEFMVRDFLETSLPTRTIHALIPPRDTVISLRLTRGSAEKVGKIQTRRVDLYDDLTLIQAWLDADGNLIQLEAPAQKVRVRRLPPGKDEAQAASDAAGPAFTAKTPTRR